MARWLTRSHTQKSSTPLVLDVETCGRWGRMETHGNMGFRRHGAMRLSDSSLMTTWTLSPADTPHVHVRLIHTCFLNLVIIKFLHPCEVFACTPTRLTKSFTWQRSKRVKRRRSERANSRRWEGCTSQSRAHWGVVHVVLSKRTIRTISISHIPTWISFDIFCKFNSGPYLFLRKRPKTDLIIILYQSSNALQNVSCNPIDPTIAMPVQMAFLSCFRARCFLTASFWALDITFIDGGKAMRHLKNSKPWAKLEKGDMATTTRKKKRLRFPWNVWSFVFFADLFIKHLMNLNIPSLY